MTSYKVKGGPSPGIHDNGRDHKNAEINSPTLNDVMDIEHSSWRKFLERNREKEGIFKKKYYKIK